MTICIDGATDVVGKQRINVMACGPKPFFIENMSLELGQRETAIDLLK